MISQALPQSLHQTSSKGATTHYSVVQWENEIINQQITTDHVQETNLSAEDEMVNNNSPYSSETWSVIEEPDRENYNMAGKCMIEEICATLRACC